MTERDPSFEHGESRRGYTEAIISAIRTGDTAELSQALQEVDQQLMGDWAGGKFESQVPRQQNEIARFLQGMADGKYASAIIYLGDGGISRLILRYEDEEISVDVSNVSSERVKKQWAEQG